MKSGCGSNNMYPMTKQMVGALVVTMVEDAMCAAAHYAGFYGNIVTPNIIKRALMIRTMNLDDLRGLFRACCEGFPDRHGDISSTGDDVASHSTVDIVCSTMEMLKGSIDFTAPPASVARDIANEVTAGLVLVNESKSENDKGNPDDPLRNTDRHFTVVHEEIQRCGCLVCCAMDAAEEQWEVFEPQDPIQQIMCECLEHAVQFEGRRDGH